MDDERLHQGADTILRGFEDYHNRFRVLTERTKRRFEKRDWTGIRRDTVERFKYQPQALRDTLELLNDQFDGALAERALWSGLKKIFTEVILGRDDFELAQTFFNSLTRKLHPHIGVDPAIDYVSKDFPLPYRGWEMANARTYAVHQVTPAVVRRILEDADFRTPFDRFDMTCHRVAERVQSGIDDRFGVGELEALDVLRPVFVRNKGAYIVGRARLGEETQPLILAIAHGGDEGSPHDGLQVDAVLQTEDEASIVFSFARWYLHAEVENPRSAIGFLRSILPRKRLAELYLSLGYSKHGKTEFYSDLVHQIESSHEQFVVARGERGLVMAVFTLPSYEFVFKVIKDTFPQSKQTSRREIMERYRLVLLHDRVGRLVDFQEFEDLAFPRERFSDELLDDLLAVASNTVLAEDGRVILRHLYVGRRVYPLNLYIRERSREEAVAAVIDWGQTLKDLAAANIFAGDMLLKNFGVTRHGRVVFYDYDELQPLVDINFRKMPQPRDEIEELLPEPHFSVGPNDVFPEELEVFMGLGGDLREIFLEHHGDLFSVDLWRGMQERIRAGEMVEFFPYAQDRRIVLD